MPSEDMTFETCARKRTCRRVLRLLECPRPGRERALVARVQSTAITADPTSGVAVPPLLGPTDQHLLPPRGVLRRKPFLLHPPVLTLVGAARGA